MSIDTILGISGTILGIIGLITGYIFYRKGLRVKIPTVSIFGNTLVQESISKFNGIEIFYKGNKVDDLTVTKVLLWNQGRETISRNDLVEANPLRIEIEGESKIFDVSIIKTMNPANQFSAILKPDGKSAEIVFDYVDKDQGAVIQVIHTSKDSKSIKVKGDFKGAVLESYLPQNELKRGISKLVFPLLSFVVLIGSLKLYTTTKSTLILFIAIGISLVLQITSPLVERYLRTRKIPTGFKSVIGNSFD
ncbi:MAG: hypothetical protein FD146_2154 [Anaerolineaceae bacterium]|nr:MAG: hypothetical protein FD146_2154 [Anaerolineaceae bacterium]